MKPKYRAEDKVNYHSYISCYVGEILCIHDDPDGTLNKLNGYVPLKPSSVGSPDMYLGTKLNHLQLHDGIWGWSMSPFNYVKEAVRIFEEYVAKYLCKGHKL